MDIRLLIFISLLAVLVCVEFLFERKTRVAPRKERWFTNFAISITNTAAIFVMGLIIPLLAVGAAIHASENGWGLLNQLNMPSAVEIIIAVLVLDFIIWGQHLLTHKIPLLWRLHRVHHADRDVDVTTAIRFHPIEIILSMLIKISAVYLLGAAALAVLIFEIMLNGMAMFNHANIALPQWCDKILRRLIVTPDMHRVHHSINRDEHDSNYGFSLSIWDQMFGTYIPEPRDGHDKMTLGLQWQDERPAKLGWSLLLPFKRK